MPLKLFITGTDTNIGKTYISIGLLNGLNKHGYVTLGLKPIASGCDLIKGKLYNGDALELQKASSFKLKYDQINSFRFKDPIAPHIAAKRHGVELTKEAVIQKLNETFLKLADIDLIEGAGGWAVPLNDNELMADMVLSIGAKVILVIGIKLGCLNHAILTAEFIKNSGVDLVGWIANIINPDMIELDENIMALKQWIKSPCLGIVPFNGLPEDYIELKKIKNCL